MDNVIIKNEIGQTNCIVGFDTEVNAPFFRWYGYTQLSELERACEAMLKMVKDSGASQYYSDNREAEGFTEDLPAYTAAHFIPKLASAGIKQHAMILSKEIFAQMIVEEFEKGLANYFEAKVHNSLEEGLNWLENKKSPARAA